MFRVGNYAMVDCELFSVGEGELSLLVNFDVRVELNISLFRMGSEGGGELVANLLLNFSFNNCWIVVIESPRLDLSTSPSTACEMGLD